MNNIISISDEDKRTLLTCNELKNSDYAEAIMNFMEKYQILSSDDLSVLTSREKSRELFKSDYAILRKIDPNIDVLSQVKDRTGRNRFYSQVYTLCGNQYVMTSQLYGYSADSTHSNNRTPFLNWFLEKAGIVAESQPKAWLLTWNPANYSFDHYEDERTAILNGKSFTEPWACSNTHVSIGDRVYLMRTGTGSNNGIIASGFAVKESYSAPHYLPKKRDAGEEIRKIDVQFDCLLDRNGTVFLDQATLMELFPDQRWNPQGSGISIKSEYIEPLEAKWKSICDEDNAWWPSHKEYDPGLTKEQWVVFLGNKDVFTTKRLTALAEYYALGGRATMRELEDEYGNSSDSYRNTFLTISDRAVEFFGIQACNQKNAKTWPCMFFGKNVDKGRAGSYEWKMRPEFYDALTEINILQYLNGEDPGVPFVLPDAFSDSVSRRFVRALLAKPFVILTGNSGTGKTRIATKFAEYMEATCKDGGKNYALISVGADWTDNSAILGYFNPMANEGKGEYVETEILKLFVRATENPSLPFFLILDEMNLSHVERYFADFLSHMETPKTPFKIENYSNREYKYPTNLFVVGTVNIDETTYMFSPKVLDRANVIEFKPEKDSVLSLFDQQQFNGVVVKGELSNIKAFMSLARTIRKDDYNADLTTAKDIFGTVYDVLNENGFEYAYRTVKEICRYLYASKELSVGDELDIHSAIDEQILQKLLPKIHGNKRTIGDMLDKLKKIFEDNNLYLSLAKIKQMQRKLENTQYVSFI